MGMMSKAFSGTMRCAITCAVKFLYAKFPPKCRFVRPKNALEICSSCNSCFAVESIHTFVAIDFVVRQGTCLLIDYLIKML